MGKSHSLHPHPDPPDVSPTLRGKLKKCEMKGRAEQNTDEKVHQPLQTIGKSHTRCPIPRFQNSTYLQLDPPTGATQRRASPAPPPKKITSIISIISIISIAWRGRKKWQSKITPTRENHRRIPCPVLPPNWLDFSSPLKFKKNGFQKEPTHFNHFNRLAGSASSQKEAIEKKGPLVNHRQIDGGMSYRSWTKFPPPLENEKTKNLAQGGSEQNADSGFEI